VHLFRQGSHFPALFYKPVSSHVCARFRCVSLLISLALFFQSVSVSNAALATYAPLEHECQWFAARDVACKNSAHCPFCRCRLRLCPPARHFQKGRRLCKKLSHVPCS
jgi:hypothetical protein